jgi:hypothetical protein
MTWLPWIELDRRIRALIAERLEHGATDELDAKILAAAAEREELERKGWFS